NILGAILGYAEMAHEDSPVDSSFRNDIEQILKAGHRARELVKQILAFSRQSEAERIPLQPAVIVKEASKILFSSLPSTIAIKHNIDPHAGIILADPTQIHQILMNLCTNAYHAMEEMGGIISISLQKKFLSSEDLISEPHLQSGNFVQLSVEDTGTGIKPELLERIFEPFFTTKEVGKGTGMGLSIIHGIMKSYNGFMTCQSKFGKGTIFQVFFPVIEDGLQANATETIDPVRGGNEHILYVDDEEILLGMSRKFLQKLGYKVTTRRNGLEALTTFRDQPDSFNLVITDQTMPGMTGSDLSRAILQIRPDIPIILCTGYSSIISEDKARSIGIKGFVMKPLAIDDFATLIRKVLED
ncbi:MAG: response regulator, partial [Desulfobulbaceae bacterium]